MYLLQTLRRNMRFEVEIKVVNCNNNGCISTDFRRQKHCKNNLDSDQLKEFI